MFVRNAQRTSSQVRRQLVPVLLITSIDALHEGMQIRLPLHRGQVYLKEGLAPLLPLAPCCNATMGRSLGWKHFVSAKPLLHIMLRTSSNGLLESAACHMCITGR